MSIWTRASTPTRRHCFGVALSAAAALLATGCLPFDQDAATPRAKGTVVVVSLATSPTAAVTTRPATAASVVTTPTAGGDRFRLELVTPPAGAAPASGSVRTPTPEPRAPPARAGSTPTAAPASGSTRGAPPTMTLRPVATIAQRVDGRVTPGVLPTSTPRPPARTPTPR